VPRCGGPLLRDKQRGAVLKTEEAAIAGRVEGDRLDAGDEALKDLLPATAAGLGS